MRNRAKCKLCGDILESFHRHDFVRCKCDEIAIDGGQDYLRVMAKNWGNFIRLDDNDNELPMKVKEELEEAPKNMTHSEFNPPTRQDKLDMLKGMIDSYERLPSHAIHTSVTQDDMAAALLLIYEILKD